MKNYYYLISTFKVSLAKINRYPALTRTHGLHGLLLHLHLMVMADADSTVYLVEQSRTQIGELAAGDECFGIQAIVGEELSEVQTLEVQGVEK